MFARATAIAMVLAACGPSAGTSADGSASTAETSTTGGNGDGTDTTGGNGGCSVDIASNAMLSLSTTHVGDLEAHYAWWSIDHDGEEFVALTATTEEVQTAIEQMDSDVELPDALLIRTTGAASGYAFRFHGFSTSVPGSLERHGDMWVGGVSGSVAGDWSMSGTFEAIPCPLLDWPTDQLN